MSHRFEIGDIVIGNEQMHTNLIGVVFRVESLGDPLRCAYVNKGGHGYFHPFRLDLYNTGICTDCKNSCKRKNLEECGFFE